jgi:hypothetical protein
MVFGFYNAGGGGGVHIPRPTPKLLDYSKYFRFEHLSVQLTSECEGEYDLGSLVYSYSDNKYRYHGNVERDRGFNGTVCLHDLTSRQDCRLLVVMGQDFISALLASVAYCTVHG